MSLGRTSIYLIHSMGHLDFFYTSWRYFFISWGYGGVFPRLLVEVFVEPSHVTALAGDEVAEFGPSPVVDGVEPKWMTETEAARKRASW
jgi:hypothetical protein